jgi:hypothetical protein
MSGHSSLILTLQFSLMMKKSNCSIDEWNELSLRVCAIVCTVVHLNILIGNDERINRVATEITSSLHHQPLQQQLANESREKTSANASQPQIPAPSSIPPSNSKPNIPKGNDSIFMAFGTYYIT